jgi:hypothetical protein
MKVTQQAILGIKQSYLKNNQCKRTGAWLKWKSAAQEASLDSALGSDAKCIFFLKGVGGPEFNSQWFYLLPQTTNTTIKTHGDIPTSCIRHFSTMGAAHIRITFNKIPLRTVPTEYTPPNRGFHAHCRTYLRACAPHILCSISHNPKLPEDSTPGRHRRT